MALDEFAAVGQGECGIFSTEDVGLSDQELQSMPVSELNKKLKVSF